MSDKIEQGDLTKCVIDCCGKDVGAYRVATSIVKLEHAHLVCHACQAVVAVKGDLVMIDEAIPNNTISKVFPLYWMRRVPPSAPEETYTEREELFA